MDDRPMAVVHFGSAEGARSLTLEPVADIAGRPYRAVLRCEALAASALVQINRASLTAFVDGIALDWRGWEGVREYSVHPAGTDYSPPGLRILATSDTLGHALLTVSLGVPCIPAPRFEDFGVGSWTAEASIEIEPSQHESLQRDVRRLPFDSDGWW
ncbi:MAG: DUF6228 family protein [Aquihabitans sp.]